MPRGSHKTERGRKERKIRALVSRMPDRETFFDHLTNLDEEERRSLWHQFGKYVGQALPRPAALQSNQERQ